MKRRNFLTSAAAGAAAMTAACSAPAPEAPAAAAKPDYKDNPVRLYVGTQRSPTNDEMLMYFKRHGVNHICAYPPRPPYPERGYWEVEELVQMKELCDKHGITIDTVAAPFLASSHIDREKRPNDHARQRA